MPQSRHIQIGYKLTSEGFSARDLVRLARAAEEHGFSFATQNEPESEPSAISRLDASARDSEQGDGPEVNATNVREEICVFMKAITPTKSSECSILQPKFIRAGVTKSIESGLTRSCFAREKLQPSRKRKKLEGRRLLKWSGRSAMRRVKEAIARPEKEISQCCCWFFKSPRSS